MPKSVKQSGYKKILSKPFGSILPAKNREGSAAHFLSTHLELLKDREINLRLSDFDTRSAIANQKKACEAYRAMVDHPVVQSLIKAVADLEQSIIINSAIGYAEVKMTTNKAKVNGVEKEWAIVRTTFPTDDPKNQFIRVYAGVVDPKTKEVKFKDGSKAYSLGSANTEQAAAKVMREEMEKRLAEVPSVEELVEKVNSIISKIVKKAK